MQTSQLKCPFEGVSSCLSLWTYSSQTFVGSSIYRIALERDINYAGFIQTTYSGVLQRPCLSLRYYVEMEGTIERSAKVALCAFWLTGGLRKRGEIGGKALQWELHSRFELPSPLQSAWCKLNEVPLPLHLHPSHSPSAERAQAGGWQRYNQFAIHRCAAPILTCICGNGIDC